ncbi:MAG: hypothetical protein BWY26_01515 [Elusimicrobia bacterium ADurb.Bin231]|nr:MAG: hypothetical protein BWY26_01515 [Elusimicrobia bacterium ADurb.Bin231]
MLSRESISEIAAKNQTGELNVLREYFQHVFLANLYRTIGTDKIAFKGGTALRIVYNSPRFSEDLDFSSAIKPYHLNGILEETIAKIKYEGFDLQVNESKETSGGFLAIYEFSAHGWNIRVELNISARQKAGAVKSNTVLITTPLYPPYTIVALDEKILIKEKIEALVYRKKPRDIFDLYFILRNRMAISEILPYKNKIEDVLANTDEKSLNRELKIFLPRNYRNILTGFLPKLKNELKKL